MKKITYILFFLALTITSVTVSSQVVEGAQSNVVMNSVEITEWNTDYRTVIKMDFTVDAGVPFALVAMQPGIVDIIVSENADVNFSDIQANSSAIVLNALPNESTYTIYLLIDQNQVPDVLGSLLFGEYVDGNMPDQSYELANTVDRVSPALQVDFLNGSTYVKKSSIFETSVNYDYLMFDHVEVDGVALDGSAYSVYSGSTIIQFNTTFLNGLEAKEHTLDVVYRDGRVAAGKFLVQAEANTNNGVVTPPITNTNVEGGPTTGDTSSTTGLLILLSLSGIFLVNRALRKR